MYYRQCSIAGQVLRDLRSFTHVTSTYDLKRFKQTGGSLYWSPSLLSVRGLTPICTASFDTCTPRLAYMAALQLPIHFLFEISTQNDNQLEFLA